MPCCKLLTKFRNIGVFFGYKCSLYIWHSMVSKGAWVLNLMSNYPHVQKLHVHQTQEYMIVYKVTPFLLLSSPWPISWHRYTHVIIVFKRYSSTYCLMQGSCAISSNFEKLWILPQNKSTNKHNVLHCFGGYVHVYHYQSHPLTPTF